MAARLLRRARPPVGAAPLPAGAVVRGRRQPSAGGRPPARAGLASLPDGSVRSRRAAGDPGARAGAPEARGSPLGLGAHPGAGAVLLSSARLAGAARMAAGAGDLLRRA